MIHILMKQEAGTHVYQLEPFFGPGMLNSNHSEHCFYILINSKGPHNSFLGSGANPLMANDFLQIQLNVLITNGYVPVTIFYSVLQLCY